MRSVLLLNEMRFRFGGINLDVGMVEQSLARKEGLSKWLGPMELFIVDTNGSLLTVALVASSCQRASVVPDICDGITAIFKIFVLAYNTTLGIIVLSLPKYR